jgi:hypothetical protein
MFSKHRKTIKILNSCLYILYRNNFYKKKTEMVCGVNIKDEISFAPAAVYIFCFLLALLWKIRNYCQKLVTTSGNMRFTFSQNQRSMKTMISCTYCSVTT